MIGFLPSEVDGELLWSTLSRAADSSGGFVSAVLSEHPRLLNPRMPGALAKLESVVEDDGWTVEAIFENRTLYSYFKKLPEDFFDTIKGAAFRTDGHSPSYLLQNLLGSIKNLHQFQVCPMCIEGAQHEFGFAYLRREHQLPGVRYCSLHNCWLRSFNVENSRGLGFSSLTPDSGIVNVPRIDAELAKYVAYRSDRILHGQSPIRDKKRLMTQLIELKWVSDRGALISNRLLNNWVSKYSAIADELSVNASFDRQWIKQLVNSLNNENHAVHPLWHLLLEKLVLDATLEDPQFLLFGDRRGGLLDCPNPLCTDRSRVYLGQNHQCPMCNYTIWVSRKRVAVGKILDRGEVWRRELKRLLDDETPLKIIAKKLGASPLNIKREAAELGFKARWKKPVERIEVKPSVKKLLSYRQEWTALRAEQPCLGRKALRGKAPVAWKWLYRNDRSWLEAHSPVARNRWGEPIELI